MTVVVQLPTTPAIDPLKIIDAYGLIRRVDMARVTDVRNRSSAIVWPRHELSYLLSVLGGLSYSDIGFHTGGRDASSVMNSVQRINQRRGDDPAYGRALGSLGEQVQAHCLALASDAPQGPSLACRVMAGPETSATDVEALAINVLSAFAILGASGLTDAEARRAALGVLGRDGGRADG